MVRMHWLVVASLATVSLPTVALACSPVPAGFVAPTPSQIEIDEAALQTFRQSEFIAQVVVERAPRARLRNETRPPPPGRLRVLTAIKGTPPSVIEVPLPDPCFFYFQTVGERVVVSLEGRNGPATLTPATAASLRRRRIGDWSRVH